ncbi:hypothetical protein M6B38_365405 [Iris pallida]|uniref:Uncharacterized protein n=1 Tax=Iris pallida TaxID=29817 RepID=A0AAX6GGG7_IRIPA|nr:hypothetical protein M6B38_365405 [Iris pallida]
MAAITARTLLLPTSFPLPATMHQQRRRRTASSSVSDDHAIPGD